MALVLANGTRTVCRSSAARRWRSDSSAAAVAVGAGSVSALPTRGCKSAETNWLKVAGRCSMLICYSFGASTLDWSVRAAGSIF